VLAAVASGAGALVVLAGAVWSAWRVRRGALVLANGLIALGTLITGASGLLNSVVNAMTAFSVTLAIGIVVIFAGFLVATNDAPPRVSRPAPDPPATAAAAASPSAHAGEMAAR
jgi:hypothetical protein